MPRERRREEVGRGSPACQEVRVRRRKEGNQEASGEEKGTGGKHALIGQHRQAEADVTVAGLHLFFNRPKVNLISNHNYKIIWKFHTAI
jgi:hypothetical protein